MNTMPKEPRQSTTSYRTNPLGAPPSTATTTTSGSMSSASGTTATATAAAVAGTSSTAASNARASTTWSADDDEQLMRARAQGLNWQPIAARFFPGKTANACRKRHERLMERQKAENWDGVRLETLATEYARARRAMWTMLGERVGEKWTVVEQKCMEKGIKTLLSVDRSVQRKERGMAAEGDDSGICCSDAEIELDEGQRRDSDATTVHSGPPHQPQEGGEGSSGNGGGGGGGGSTSSNQRGGPSIQSMLSPSPAHGA